ncbi:MAG: cell division protein ZipA, partial [Gammaproteobacteria bacterium]|nr:cell division protein ZipA [Gammaproteobacteria bacterium]
EMLACARQLAQTLGGEMLDERRSAWSRQIEVHTREQIQEYLRLAVKQAR